MFKIELDSRRVADELNRHIGGAGELKPSDAERIIDRVVEAISERSVEATLGVIVAYCRQAQLRTPDASALEVIKDEARTRYEAILADRQHPGDARSIVAVLDNEVFVEDLAGIRMRDVPPEALCAPSVRGFTWEDGGCD